MKQRRRKCRQPRPFGKAALAILLSFAAGIVQATPGTDAAARLADIEHQRVEQAQTQAIARRDLASAQTQAARLADARARQAAALQQTEASVIAAQARLADARAGQQAAEAALVRTQQAFESMLPMMLALSRTPAEAVLAVPLPPDQAIRGLLITRGLAVTLNRRAGVLRAQQAAAASAGVAASAQAAALLQARADQSAGAAALDRVVAEARGQVTQAEAEGRAAAEQVAAAGAQARTLREAIAAMDAAQARAAMRAAGEAASASRQHRDRAAQAALARQAAVTRPAGTALAQSAGQLIPPVAGPVLRAFGAAAEDGPATGTTYAAAGGGFVSSPCAGRVAFAAPFRSFGQLLILECGGGYDIVLAGLGSIAVRPGHAARPGEPLGRMPDGGKASLYLELRAKGRPVDPAPFLKAKL